MAHEGFMLQGAGSSSEVPILVKRLIANSQTIKIGLAVKMNTDDETIEAVGTGTAVYGIIHGIEQEAGSAPPRDDGAGGDYYLTYTAPADNETVKKMNVLINTNKRTKYHVNADDTLGTNSDSDQANHMFDCVTASDELDESTSSTSSGQFMSHGVWAENSEMLVVSINESSVTP